jgi:hypothetical protein
MATVLVSIRCTSDNKDAYKNRHNKLRSPNAHNVLKPLLNVPKCKVFFPTLLLPLNTSPLSPVIKQFPLRVRLTDLDRQLFRYDYHTVW